MTEEEKKAAEEKARADADAGTKLDKLLTGLDSMGKRFDAVESRMDAFEAAAKKPDTARKDKFSGFSKRGDGESSESYCSRHDTEEAAHRDEMEEAGEPKEVAADKAKRARKDAEAKEAKEAAEAKAAADKAKKDAAEEEERKKVDAASAEFKNRLDGIERMMRHDEDADYTARCSAQEKADSVFQAFGDSAPRPMQGETSKAYRLRVGNKLKAHSTRWKDVDLETIADSKAFGVAEDQIYADAVTAARNPLDIPDGELRIQSSMLPSGHRENKFFGRPSAWMNRFGGNRQCVSAINTNLKDR